MSTLDLNRSIRSGMGNKRYMPGLDGLRAISVLAVIAYHLNWPYAPGGLLGVSIFFTLSGYLITDQLLGTWQIDLKDFWVRRIRRLIPGLLFMLGIVALYLLLFDRDMLVSQLDDFLSVILYFNNWWLIFHKVSYFQSFGAPSPIGHLWSLAIEEQFYMLWPLLLIFMLRYTPRRSKMICLTITGALASVIAMAVIYNVGTDPSRVYYGTDTRAFALLIGAALAMVWPSWNLPEKVSDKTRLMLDAVGVIGLIGIFWTIGITNEYDPALYLGGLAIFSVVAAAVTAVLAHPASRFGKYLGAEPLRWIGMRSYSLYLWHYPVIALTSPAMSTTEFNASRAFIQVAITFALAALSYKYIEVPFRRGSFGLWTKKVRSSPSLTLRYTGILVLIALMVFVFAGPRDLSEDQTYASAPDATEERVDSITPPSVEPVTPPVVAEQPNEIPVVDPNGNPAATPANPVEQPPAAAVKTDQMVTVIGDSVVLGAEPYLRKFFPGILIDGVKGRQMNEAQSVANSLRAQGKIGKIVIIELGSNGPFQVEKFRGLLTSLKDVEQIVVVNTRVPRKWESMVNSDLKTITAEFANATLVDWYSATEGKDSYFYNDGCHLRPAGGEAFASIVSKAVKISKASTKATTLGLDRADNNSALEELPAVN